MPISDVLVIEYNINIIIKVYKNHFLYRYGTIFFIICINITAPHSTLPVCFQVVKADKSAQAATPNS